MFIDLSNGAKAITNLNFKANYLSVERKYKEMGDLKNYFAFSNHVENLLFKDVTVSSNEAMFGLCVGVAVFTFVYEAIKSLRHALVILQNKRRTQHSQSDENQSETTKKDSPFATLTPKSEKTEKFTFHCIQSLLHMIQLALGYMVMLIVMSFNLWLMLTIVVTTALCFYFHEFILSRKSLIMPLEIPGSNL